MRYLILFLAFMLSACSLLPQSAPTPDITIPTPPSSDPEREVLLSVVNDLLSQSFWWTTPALKKEEIEAESGTDFSVQHSIMAGSDESASIIRYPSKESAALALGTPDGTFHGYPSRSGQTSSFESNHYGDVRWIMWQCGARLFKASTSYLSTYKGNARDPKTISESLYNAAYKYGLLDQVE
jgi:hypothetical protein